MSKITVGMRGSMVVGVGRSAALTMALVVAACTPSPAMREATPTHVAPEHQMNAIPSVVPFIGEDPFCHAPPLGALEPARPVWCHPLRGKAPRTAESGANSWVDEFHSATEHGAMPSGYRVFEAPGESLYRSTHFAHNRHWMVDIKSLGVPAGRYVGAPPDVAEPSDFGGAMVRPDRAFRARDGRIVAEADVSAGMEAYVDAWPEIVITTAPVPGRVIDPRFTYGVFGGHPAVGCRFEKDRTPVCAAFDAEKALFDLAHDRTPGGAVVGGRPQPAWRTCGAATPDAQCRDRFRVEIAPSELILSVNGTRYMEHRLTAALLPAELFTRDVYVYFASWLYQPTPAVVRFHWGRVAVNP